MARRPILTLIMGLLAVLVVVIVGGAAWLAFGDPRPLAQRWLAAQVGRQATIGSLRLDWTSPLAVDIRKIVVANHAGGSVPDMLRIERLAGRLDGAALLRGDLRFLWAEVIGIRLVMERDAAGRGNWQTSDGGGGGTQDRSGVPTILTGVLRDGLVRYRTSSGRFLDITLADLTLKAGGDDQPITLGATGSYNDIPVRLDATMQSFAALRDASKPFGANFTLANSGVRIAFDGSFTRPLDIDGAHGRLDIVARKIGDLTRIFGAPTPLDIGLKLVGDLTRDGNRWQLAEATGRLGEDVFEGVITLDEGGRGQSDDIALALDFPHLHLDPLLAGSGSGSGSDGELELAPEADAPRIALRLSAAEVDHGRLKAEDAELVARLAPGQAAIDKLNFALGGGRVTASANAANADQGIEMSADLAWSDADADALARRLGADPGMIAGRIDLRATVQAAGRTRDGLIKAAHGQAVVGMTGGLISRDLLEKLSGDLRTLFRKGEGRTQMTCLLGFITLRDGIAQLAPLRLRAAEGVAVGGGRIDLVGRRLDLVLRTERSSTNFFALDVPLRLSGSLTDPKVSPATPEAVAPYEIALGRLSPDLAPIADGNPCRR